MQNLSMFPGISETEPVRVEKTMHEHEEKIEEPLISEHIEIEHVMKNERVDGPLPVREEGDRVIVPLVKEVLRVEKEWILTEEVHLWRRRQANPSGESATLRWEEAQVSGAGDPQNRSAERRGILGGRLPVFKGKLEEWVG